MSAPAQKSGGTGKPRKQRLSEAQEHESSDEQQEDSEAELEAQEAALVAREKEVADKKRRKELEKRAKLIEAEERELLREEAEAQTEDEVDNSPGSSEEERTTMRPEERVKAIKAAKEVYELSTLEYSKLSQSDYLESWLFKWDKLSEQFELNTFTPDTTHRIVKDLMDKDLTIWFNDKMNLRRSEGKSKFSMKWLRETLKQEFVSKLDEDQATEEALTIKIGSNEDIESFTQRAISTFQRVPETRLPQQVKAELLFNAVKKESGCYPVLVATLGKEQTQSRKTMNQGMSLVKMRERLLVLAKDEPKNDRLDARNRSRTGSSGQGNSTSSKGILKNSSGKKARFGSNSAGPQISTLSHEEEEEVTQENMMEKLVHMMNALTKKQAAQDQLLAAMKSTSSSGGACSNCGKKDHWWRECPEPKKPYCRTCRKVGHTTQDCTTKPKQGEGNTEGLKDQNRGEQ